METLANVHTSSQASYAAVSEDGNGGYFIAWEDNRNGILDIYAQHLDALRKTIMVTGCASN